MKAKILEGEIKRYLERYKTGFSLARARKMFPGFVASEGHGTVIKDIKGKEYLDFSTPSAIVGHSHPRIIEAVKKQVEKLTHFGYAIIEPRLKLVETLKEIAPYGLKEGKVLLGCSGTDSIESALKLVKYHTRRPVVMSYIGGHHGRSPGILPFTSDYSRSKIYSLPYIVESLYVPYPYCYSCILGQVYPDCSLACLDYIKHVLDEVVPPEGVAAILVEPLLSWSGFVKPPPDYLSKLKKLCEEHGILFVDDEVFTGFGRTGKMFAIEHFGVEPNVMSTGKPMGAGMPLSALLAGREMMDEWETIGASSSAGNLLACVSSMMAIEIIKEEKLEKRAQRLGEYLMAGLKDQLGENESVGDIRGMGFLLGIELVKDKYTKEPDPEKAKRVFRGTFKKGVLLNEITGAYHNVIRIVAPLTVTKEELDKLLEVLYEVFREA